ncbi:hypothetical protein PULV_a3316 [Pseudoalteromonas ulvae UL12]|uniref:LysR family transcriptional regulator n=1 Tax=Pseudoalteromonas ulvae TaxID=107327 RepID=A0A244CPP2_PSEDV|nr:LysR family transcriptional regulator [Pseudoalteromonas ulvae]MBE0365015.1 hypothetical protein [Pseudoalteromonas ulvae UL12]OUL57574.1 LysR family transcriptional regulator [Pseudoalteromonas ulvae]
MNNYKLLPALMSLLNTRNLTESAKQLNVSQSAMSKTLILIRQSFNDPILIREGNSFRLTHRAEQLKQQLPTLLSSIDALYLPESFDLALCDRQFNLASSDYVAQFVLPEICHQMQHQASHATINYQLWQSAWLSELADQNIDLVSTIADGIPENLYGIQMTEDPLVVVMRKGHPLSQFDLDLKLYCDARHIVISGGGDKDSALHIALNKLNKQRKIFANVPFFQTAIELLSTTDTILTTPLHIAATYAKRNNLVIKPLPLVVKNNHYYVLWHAKYHHDPAHKWFRELCFPLFKQHILTTVQLGQTLIHQNK